MVVALVVSLRFQTEWVTLDILWFYREDSQGYLITHLLMNMIPVLVLLRRRVPCSSISADVQEYQA